MSRNREVDVKRVVKELESNPNIERACVKLSIARSTLYRWMDEDEEIEVRIEMALEVGRGRYIDICESKLMENIARGDQRSIEFFLRGNSSRYRTPHIKYYEEKHAEELAKKDREIALLARREMSATEKTTHEEIFRFLNSGL